MFLLLCLNDLVINLHSFLLIQNQVLYKITFSALYLLSLLPFKVLYVLSDILYFILLKVFKYRLEVVTKNLKNAFPEKSDHEIQRIITKYYKNLCDSIVETLKLISISKEELSRRMVCNWEMFDSMTIQNRNGQGYMSHQFNWEWGTVLCNWYAPRRFTGLYLRLTNKVMDKIFIKIRSRSGTRLIDIDQMQQQMADVQGKESLWGFIADQNPPVVRRASWHLFLNQQTAFFKAPETVARRYNNLVYFGEMIKIKRGYYQIKMKLAFENPKDTKEGEITEAYVRHLEDSIKRQPENWVWSHRRWKHVYPSKTPH
jgi:KDO2-lipid IV(A) lauroyltransferase